MPYPLSWVPTVLLLIEKLTAQLTKCISGPILTDITGLTIFPTILKQPPGCKGGAMFGRVSYSTHQVATPWQAGEMLPERLYMC